MFDDGVEAVLLAPLSLEMGTFFTSRRCVLRTHALTTQPSASPEALFAR